MRRSARPRGGCSTSRRALVVDRVDHLVHARHAVVLDERRQLVDALVLLRVGLAAPAVVVVDRHVEQAERDDLVLVADVAGVVGALEARRLVLARIPRAPELVPGAWLEPAGTEHDDHEYLLGGPCRG